jgi:hypothetical protein
MFGQVQPALLSSGKKSWIIEATAKEPKMDGPALHESLLIARVMLITFATLVASLALLGAFRRRDILLADEHDSAQERGELAFQQEDRSSKTEHLEAITADIGLTRKDRSAASEDEKGFANVETPGDRQEMTVGLDCHSWSFISSNICLMSGMRIGFSRGRWNFLQASKSAVY